MDSISRRFGRCCLISERIDSGQKTERKLFSRKGEKARKQEKKRCPHRPLLLAKDCLSKGHRKQRGFRKLRNTGKFERKMRTCGVKT